MSLTSCSCWQQSEEQKINTQINKQLKQDQRYLNSKIKLLLLGAGESGKSTFFKQMRIIHMNSFTGDKEREDFKHTVYTNIITNMVSLLVAADKLGIPLLADNLDAIQRLYSLDASNEEIRENGIVFIVDDLKRLWTDPGIRECFERASEFQLNDSTEYFFENLDRIAKSDYLPSVEDILRIRVKTSGIIELDFKVGRDTFCIVDVGGQRSERRKWIHCFENVTAIIFFASLSEYDQKLSEEETTNRMSEALKLFKDIANYKTFVEKETAIILFLNKKDLFEKKLQKVPLNVYFKDYQGPNEYEEASEYVRKKFLELAPPGKQIYVHKTCATDTVNIRIVFKAVKEIIVSAYLKGMGLLSYDMMGAEPAPMQEKKPERKIDKKQSFSKRPASIEEQPKEKAENSDSDNN